VLDGLESRLVLSAVAASPHAQVAAHVATPVQAQGTASVPISVTGINLTNITRDATTGVLTATGTLTGKILGQQFTTPTTLTITPGATSTATPILNLHLNAIHLNVLGLKVDTSPIDLKITAQPGGGLLGDLLGSSGLGGLVSGVTGSTNLNNLLGSLNSFLNSTTGGLAGSGGTGGLLGGLSSVLSNLTGQATIPTGGAAHSPGAVTNLLHLSVGPVDLNLLGLNVHLDNGSNGPVTVDVSAQRGPGNLLGNLLTSVAHLLDGPHSPISGVTAQAKALLGLIENI
jgi:hypothetical protein